MKMLAALVLVISFQASAVEVIAKATDGSGFSPVPMWSIVEVRDNGKVVLKTPENGRGKLLTTLSAQSVAQIVKLSADLVPAQLVQVVENRPPCMDAGATTYSVKNARAEWVNVGGNWNCNDMRYPTYNYAASRLDKILAGLYELSLSR